MIRWLGATLITVLALAPAQAADPQTTSASTPTLAGAGFDWMPEAIDLVLQGPVHVVGRERAAGDGLVVAGAAITWDTAVHADGAAVEVGTTVVAGALRNAGRADVRLVDGRGREHVVTTSSIVLVGVDVRPGNEFEMVILVPAVNIKTGSINGFSLGPKLQKKCMCRCGPTGPLQVVNTPPDENCIDQNGGACTDAQGSAQWQECRKRFVGDNPGGGPV